jgi:hypothetical protein
MYDYNRIAQSLNLQHKTIWEVKVQWAHDILSSVSELARRLPGTGTVSHNSGSVALLEVRGYDKSDLEWTAKVELEWSRDTLVAEVLFDHVMRGRSSARDRFDETAEAMEIAEFCLSSLKKFIG